MQHYIMYDKTNGMIKSTGCVDDITRVKIRNNCEFVRATSIVDTELKYFDLETKKIKTRPQNNWDKHISVSVNEMFTFNDVPKGTNVYFDSELLITVNDGVLDLDIPMEGRYQLKFETPFPYFSHTVTIEVNENG